MIQDKLFQPKNPSTKPDTVPNSDPAKEVIADDVGLTDQSPLIQEGDRTPVEEVVADVDLELDQMEKLIGGMGGAAVPEGGGHADEAPIIDEAAVGVSDHETTAPEEGAALHALPGLPGEPQPAPAGGMDAGAAASDAGDAALIDSAAPEEPAGRPSRREQSLDDDIDALLANGREAEDQTADDEQLAHEDSSVVDEIQSDTAAPNQQAESTQEPDWGSITVWQLVKTRLLARSKRTFSLLRERLGEALVGLLDKIDGLIGDRLPAAVREVIGYCALGTLAMCLVAVLIALLR